MEKERPNPDALLRKIETEEDRQKRGKLKIFFGYAAGVGKTYAMLDAAHTAKNTGIDVVVGYVEPHTRPETLALLDGLEQLPPREIPYKGITLREFDLDAALKRRPQLILVDELAHTNAAGSRHTKRYSDVEELLRAGINVYTTVNVQHLESLNDIVASITQVIVQERIPDRIFDSADQVELVDIEPDDLIERLNEGKIYRQVQAKRALHHFFIRENLVALREIALRRTADRVNHTAEKADGKGAYFTGEHILICLSSSPSNAKVIRTAARMANVFHASFTALFVETPRTTELSGENRKRLRQNLKLAEQLGARISTVYGEDVPSQIAEYAKASGVSKIVMGRSNSKRRLLGGNNNFVDRLTRLAPNLDVYIIPDAKSAPYRTPNRLKHFLKNGFSAADLLKTVLILAASTVVALAFDHVGFSEANVVTIYILGVLATSTVTSGSFYGIAASVVSVLVFNFFFTDPRLTFQAPDNYAITFAVMLASALITSTLTRRNKEQARAAARKAHRTEVLLETSQKLQRARNRQEIILASSEQILRLIGRSIVIYPVESSGELGFAQGYDGPEPSLTAESCLNPEEKAVAVWVAKNNEEAGFGTNTLPGSKALYLPVRNHQDVFAVVGVVMGEKDEIDPFEKSLLLGMLNEIAFAMEKERLNEAQKQASLQAERERLRANLLRAISHDLRTPLTSISGNANILLESAGTLDDDSKRHLYEDIYDDSLWLINLVENLLSVTRIDNGNMEISMKPELASEIVDEAMRHVNRKKTEHHITVDIPDDLLMVRADARLIVQVIINIVDNAIKYTPPGSHISLSVVGKGKFAEFRIADDGDGISSADKEKLFDMFFTVGHVSADSRRGLGLGLSLCKSIVTAHGGEIGVQDNHPKGTVFWFTLLSEEVQTNENVNFGG